MYAIFFSAVTAILAVFYKFFRATGLIWYLVAEILRYVSPYIENEWGQMIVVLFAGYCYLRFPIQMLNNLLSFIFQKHINILSVFWNLLKKPFNIIKCKKENE